MNWRRQQWMSDAQLSQGYHMELQSSETLHG